MTVGGEIEREILDQNEPWPPAIEVEAFEHFEFVAFHVDRHKIERRRRRRHCSVTCLFSVDVEPIFVAVGRALARSAQH